MRGKAFDIEIEKELQLMLMEGIEQSPISASSLYTRLKAKGLIKSSGLSILSTHRSKELIERYKYKQFMEFEPSPSSLESDAGRNSKAALVKRNKELGARSAELEDRLARNSATIIEIAKYIQININYSVASLLEGYLVREIRQQ
ncbi:hypothetical protein [Moraxella canis]|uniref:Uncharacterized protein n=1 Tax=Moraxella canis TaxID=90239 RepID=A0A1S9ZPV2_9GAMM|nr:hypothetical protein [Moraxella canis]OOR85486.1 hypothetical protein B0180_01465 [Moraxella canis]